MRSLVLAAVLALTLGTVPASAQKLDVNGRCHGADGKFAKAEVCANVVKPAPQRCRDSKGKFAKCGAPGAKPVK